MKETQKEFLVIDANVLIDYFETDRSIITSASNKLFSIKICSPVLDEATGLNNNEVENCGVQVVNPETNILLEAVRKGKHGPLSAQDWISFLMAKEMNWGCLTNDKSLRGQCILHGINVCWGLELMLRMVENNYLDRKTAIEVAYNIHKINPSHIGKEVISEFNRKIGLTEKPNR